jgi:molybdate transport system ATP-binding protein
MTAWLDIDIERAFPRGPTISARIGPAQGCERRPVTVLFGPSGAGKTTLLRCLAGLDSPTRGRITIDGQTWFDERHGIRAAPQHRRIGYVPQEPSLFPHLTALQNISYGLRGTPDGASRARDMLDFIGLSALADRRPGALSGGQRQKLALARALAPRPGLVLLDEPFSSLDGPVRESLRDEVRDLLVRACAPAIIVTHDLNEAAAIGDQIMVMASGRVEQIGSTADVLRRPRNGAVAAAVGYENILPGRVESRDGHLVSVLVNGTAVRAADADGLAGDVLVCIRSQDVLLGADGSAGGRAGHGYPGSIVGSRPGMPLAQVTIDCGFPLRAGAMRDDPARFSPGAKVIATIEPSSVVIVARG